MIDISQTVAPKSDQLNADDLIGGPRTITVTGVVRKDGDQPISIHFEGDGGKAKHGLRAARVCVPEHPVFVREAERRARCHGRDAEPSMADLVIEAQLNRAMGLPVDRDIAEMFDV